jgi:signal transduction histidine kinase
MFSKVRQLGPKPSILQNLTWGLILAVTLVLALVNLFFYLRSVDQIEAKLETQATDTAQRLSDVLGVPMWNYDNGAIRQIAEVYSDLDEVAYLSIQDDQGKVIYEHGDNSAATGSINRTARVVYEEHDIGQITIAISKETIQKEQRDSLFSALLSTFVIAIAIVTTNQFLLRRFLHHPMQALNQGLDQLAQGNYEHRLSTFNLVDIDMIAVSINQMAEQILIRDQQLRELIDTLEERVIARTRDLRIAADVSKQITTVLDIDELLREVVRLTAQGFSLYGASIFRLTSDDHSLYMAAGVDSTGQPLQSPNLIPLDAEPGIVALAARTREAARINDVTQSPLYLSYPSLQNARSEVAIPIMLGNRLLGVFDLQSDEVNHFSEDEMRVLHTLAEQIAVAMRNAELYTQEQNSRTEAELANQLKSQFLASMSHELRTPLNSIINFSRFVAQGAVGSINKKQEELMRMVIESSEHLLSLINDVLDISKIESGLLELLVDQDVDINRILSGVITTGQGLLVNKPVELVLDIGELPPIVADQRRIRQIILNIVSNACKFTTKGSITIKAWQDNGEIKIMIKDTGPGIAAEDHEAVFETFRQTEVGLAHGTGTGLGMPISRRLAEAHGGRLWLESMPGEGATFYVALPIHSEELAQRAYKKSE